MSETPAPVTSAPVEQATRSLLHRIFSFRTLISGIATLAAAVVIATAAAGGTYALWNQSTPIGSSGTLAAGNPDLAISVPLSLSTTALSPGITNYGSIVLTNTGTIPLTLTLAGLTRSSSDNTFAQSLRVGIGTAASAAACSSGTWTAMWTGTFASAAPITVTSAVPVSAAPVVAGSTAVVCVSVGLPSTAPAGAAGQPAATLELKLAGKQV